MVVEVPLQMVLLTPALAVGLGLTVRVPEPLAVQPFASVTVTLYVPATLTLIEALVAVNPLGPVQLYVNGEVPLEMVAARLAGNALEQTVGELTDTDGLGLTVRVI